jgi:hypothetical protein
MKGVPAPQPVKELIIQRAKKGERVDGIVLEFHLYPNRCGKTNSELINSMTEILKGYDSNFLP